MRFKVGDLAKVVVAYQTQNLGRIVEISEVGPFLEGEYHPPSCTYHAMGRDYLCDGTTQGAYDWQLAPLDRREEPKSLARQQEKVHESP